MSGLTGLRKIQIAKENTPGGTVSGDYIQLIGKITAQHNYSIYRPDDFDTGLLSSYTRSEIVGEQAELTFESDFNFEQGYYLLSMAVRGNVVPINNTYDFSPVLDQPWAPDTYAFKYGDNQQAYLSRMVFAKDMEISGSIDDAVMIKCNLYGQNLSVTEFESDVKAPSHLECVKTDLGQFYLASSWNELDTAQPINASVCDFVWRITEGISPVKYLNGQLYASSITEQKRHIELELTLSHNDTYTGILLPAFINQNLIFVKIAFSGTQDNSLILKGAFKIDNPDSLSDLNGQSVIKLKLISEYSPPTETEVKGHEWQILLTKTESE